MATVTPSPSPVPDARGTPAPSATVSGETADRQASPEATSGAVAAFGPADIRRRLRFSPWAEKPSAAETSEECEQVAAGTPTSLGGDGTAAGGPACPADGATPTPAGSPSATPTGTPTTATATATADAQPTRTTTPSAAATKSPAPTARPTEAPAATAAPTEAPAVEPTEAPPPDPTAPPETEATAATDE